jgi:hypothetical protein
VASTAMNRVTRDIFRGRARVLPCPPEIDNDKYARSPPASKVLLREHRARHTADAVEDAFEDELILVDDGEIIWASEFKLLALLHELLGGDFEFTELLAGLLGDEVFVDEVFQLIGLAGEVAGPLARAPVR